MAVLWRSLLGLQAWSCRARTISGWWQCYCGFSFPEAFSPLIMHWTYFPRSFKLAVGICLFVPLLVSLLGSLKPLPWGRRLLRWRQTLNPHGSGFASIWTHHWTQTLNPPTTVPFGIEGWGTEKLAGNISHQASSQHILTPQHGHGDLEGRV